MQRNWKVIALSVATVVSLGTVTACVSKSSSETPSASPVSSAAGAAATSAAKPDPLGKYNPPVEVSVAQFVDQSTKFPAGDSIENNAWTRGYEKELGIKLKMAWSLTGTQAQYDQKLNVAIASGDLPDIFAVNAVQLKQLVEAKQVEDLTKVYADYISPLAKGFYDADGGTALKTATFDKKLMGIPQPGSYPDSAAMLYIRTDWLKKLNLPEPKTLQDVLGIADAFTTKDPDGNGKNDTYGFPFSKDFNYIEGIVNMFHAYYGIWIKDKSGRLVPGDIQPEMKTALAKLQELYKKGEIDPEFGVKDFGKINEDIASGKFGIMLAGPAAPIVPFQPGKDKDPNMEWKAYPLPSVDDKPANPQINPNVNKYMVVRKGAKNPEALIKIINFSNEKIWGKTADIDTYYQGKDGIGVYKYVFASIGDVNKNVNGYLHIKDALKNNDPSKLLPEEKLNYDHILAFRAGDPKWWNMEHVFGPDGTFGITDFYLKNNRMVTTEFYGAPTQTMVEKKASLDKMRQETFTKIIMGTVPIDEFDNYVANYKKLGGDAIIKEVNDWKAAQ